MLARLLASLMMDRHALRNLTKHSSLQIPSHLLRPLSDKCIQKLVRMNNPVSKTLFLSHELHQKYWESRQTMTFLGDPNQTDMKTNPHIQPPRAHSKVHHYPLFSMHETESSPIHHISQDSSMKRLVGAVQKKVSWHQ